MSKHILGSDRILHEGAGYRNKYAPKSQNLPVGSRENPSNPKQEGTDAVFVPTTVDFSHGGDTVGFLGKMIFSRKTL